VRALLGHKGIETTQLYAQIRPAALKEAVSFYEAKAFDNINETEMVAPNGIWQPDVFPALPFEGRATAA
jgi:hypothetical protein